MKIEYQTNFAGYITILRATFYLLKTKTLSASQFTFYLVLISQADFDRKHKLYGAIIRGDAEIAREIGCNYTTIYKNRVLLIEKGLLIEKNGITYVPNFFLFELNWLKTLAKLPSDILQKSFVKPQEPIAELKEILAKLQNKQPQDTPQSSNVSYKEDLGSSEDSYQEEVPIDYDDVDEALARERSGNQ